MRQRWSISRKLLLLVLASVLAGLVTAATVSVSVETERYLANRQRELQSIAQVFASATASAAAERDPLAARQAMTAIGRIATLKHARIKLPDGGVLTEMGSIARLTTDLKIQDGAQTSFWRTLSTRTVHVAVPITKSGNIVGELVLVGDASDLVEDLLQTLQLTIICALLALAIGLLVAARLQKGIIAPLQNLTTAMERIRKTHDYTAHVEATSDDEIGQLVDGFNETLSEICKRDGQLETLAFYDSLTGLANRALFQRTLDEALGHHSRTGMEYALFLLDLDHFKEVNDTLGHAAGDELLVKVGQLVGRVLDEQHFLARIGGDEFAIIVRGCGDRVSIARLAGRLIAGVSGPVALERGDVNIATSIGIARIPGDASSASDLVRNADLALYRAKECGRGRFAFFEPEMYSAVQHKADLARELRIAVNEGVGLAVHYQPQVHLPTNRVTGFEALMRWQHPTYGNVPASEFIPVAESSRLICDLGLWILRAAAAQAKAWLDAGESPRQVSVNLSAAQIWHTDVVSEVAGVLKETKLPPHLLCIELTESLLVDHEEGRVRSVLNALKNIGVTLALDDFGTDYSSLGYLTKLPFDKLKIDRIFINGIDESARARELLKGIIALGRGLGMALVGEGAEKPEELAILAELGCDQAQGYVFSRPAEAKDALNFARAFDKGKVLIDKHSVEGLHQPAVAA